MPSAEKLPFFVSIPHSGEKVPDEVSWLQKLPEVTLMRDVDRYVDWLYQPAIEKLNLQSLITPWHRYVVDPNRTPDDFDADAVKGAPLPSGTNPKGLHWSVTTHGETLISEAMSMDMHNKLVSDYYQPFHNSILEMRRKMHQEFGVVFQLDLHSMPSVGTPFHPDPGETRAEVVISDQHGNSADTEYKELVMDSFQIQGFQVAYNWPYIGGGITKTYGDPKNGFHTIQIELNRAQYMDEETKQLNTEKGSEMRGRLRLALAAIQSGLKMRING